MDDPSFYGFPEFGLRGRSRRPRTAAGRPSTPTGERSMPTRSMEAPRPASSSTGLVGDRRPTPRSTTCLYTLTADRDFVLDRLPDAPADRRRPSAPPTPSSSPPGSGASWPRWRWAVQRRAAELAPFSIARQALRRARRSRRLARVIARRGRPEGLRRDGTAGSTRVARNTRVGVSRGR